MERTLDFIKDITRWAKKVSKLPGAEKCLNNYKRGLITLNECYNYLANLEAVMPENTIPAKKLSWRDLKVGDKFIWIVDDFDGYSEDECVVESIDNNGLWAKDLRIEHTIFVDDDSDIKLIEEA